MPAFVSRPRVIARLFLAFSMLAAVCAAWPRAATAQIGSERYASIVIDSASGTVLSAVNADDYRYPASLTKMMTLYLLFEALRDRRVSLDQPVPVSPYAASMSPTKLGLLPGSYITVEQALLGLVTKSANDAAAALGEMMGGDEERFAQMMTLRARALGMTRTTFRNASGLPDWSQVTTARDMVLLGRRLVQDFPVYYRYFSVPSFVFQGRTIYNHQRLLQNYPGADGIKTGYIEASGYNVVTSAVRGDTRVIGVVLGAASGGERDVHTAWLLDQGFERMGVNPALMARHDPAPFHMPAFISLAHAAPPPAMRPMPMPVLAEPARFRPRPGRGASRPLFNLREDRFPARAPVASRARGRPETASAPPPARARETAPGRPGTTRTAHAWAPGRFPG